MSQTAKISILTHALAGIILTAKRGDQEFNIRQGADSGFHLQPGDTLTITAESDPKWLEREEKKAADAKAAAAVRDDVDHAKDQADPDDIAAAEAAGVDPATPPAAEAGTTRRTRSTGTPAA